MRMDEGSAAAAATSRDAIGPQLTDTALSCGGLPTDRAGGWIGQSEGSEFSAQSTGRGATRGHLKGKWGGNPSIDSQ